MGKIMDRTWMERARLEKGFSQTEMAQAIGVTIPYYNRLEKGYYLPNVVVALRLCTKLGCDIREFLREKPVL